MPDYRSSLRLWPFRQRLTTSWGGLLDAQEILVAALSARKGGGLRVLVFEHVRAPGDLGETVAQEDWLVQALRVAGSHLPARDRTMALALREGRCRQGSLVWQGRTDPRQLAAEVQLEAASALGIAPEDVGFDFEVWPMKDLPEVQVQWAACRVNELERWQRHARHAGWRLPRVEPEHQAARRGVAHLCGDLHQQWASSPQDWQFECQPQRDWTEADWAHLQSSSIWGPLVACGAALGAVA